MNESAEPGIVSVHDGIREIPASQWNALVDNGYPFLDHAFLCALERHACVGGHAGWTPRHLACFRKGVLMGAMPLYEKHNSWGEFVFDHAWADAYQRYGIPYYPKLVNAIPFTPATGQRLLAEPGERATITARLADAVTRLAEDREYSGVHSLFPAAGDFDALDGPGWVSRNDCQFHWHNADYRDFDDFLATLKSRKRKNIRHERRRVRESGVRIRRLDGDSAGDADWAAFTRLYESIYDRKYGAPAFNQGFFLEVAALMPERVLLVLAELDGRCVAGALMYRDHDTLYGRHWGCEEYVDCLHFELCYYQGIEYCLEHNLARFDPGAQGEHKIARGFVPTRTRSLHWMTPGPFNEAIRQFVLREQQGVSRYIELAHAHSPYHAAQ